MPATIQTGLINGAAMSGFMDVHLMGPLSGARVDSNGIAYVTADGKPPTNGSTVYAVKRDGTIQKATWTGGAAKS